ncbi:MAG: hypothetical protein V1670_01740 [Candidatus Omnitrophota bacterium]
MNKKMGFNRFKFWEFNVLVSVKSVTLVELLVSIMITGLLILGFYGFELFSNTQVIDAERRTKVQNDLAYCLEHMTKYIQQANGDIDDAWIRYFPASDPTGFEVRVDFNGTPLDLTDDPWVRYQLQGAGDILQVSCVGGAGCPASFAEDLADKVLGGFQEDSLLPEPLPANPSGFYVQIDAQGNSVNIGLVGRYDKTRPTNTSFVNPQVEVKTRIICNSASSI